MSISKWQQRRVEFNHDWLANQYQKALRGFLRVLAGEVRRDSEYPSEFIRRILPVWETRRGDAEWLICHFETEMSPRAQFTRPPLSRLQPEQRQWLEVVVHRLWMERHAVRERVTTAARALDEADSAYAALRRCVSSLPGPPTLETLDRCEPELTSFERATTALSTALREFPGKIQIL